MARWTFTTSRELAMVYPRAYFSARRGPFEVFAQDYEPSLASWSAPDGTTLCTVQPLTATLRFGARSQAASWTTGLMRRRPSTE